MTSKRTRTKSRLGCTQCKKARIKCDEKPPRCGRCTQKGLKCDFQEYAAVFENSNVLTPTNFGDGHVAESGSYTTASSPELKKSFCMHDLGLLHYFTLYTSYTLPPIERELYCHIWRREVPQLAQSHGFLVHAVLGFAAAHQATTSDVDPRLRDYSSVRHHYSRALSLFREGVDVINESEQKLCFALAS